MQWTPYNWVSHIKCLGVHACQPTVSAKYYHDLTAALNIPLQRFGQEFHGELGIMLNVSVVHFYQPLPCVSLSKCLSHPIAVVSHITNNDHRTQSDARTYNALLCRSNFFRCLHRPLPWFSFATLSPNWISLLSERPPLTRHARYGEQAAHGDREDPFFSRDCLHLRGSLYFMIKSTLQRNTV